MAKTYTLTSTACLGGGYSTWTSGYWSNFYEYPNNRAGCVLLGGNPGPRAVYYMFNSSTLATLRGKTVTSVKLKITVVSGIIPRSSSTFYQIGYKKTSEEGSGSSSSAWVRSNASSTESSTESVGYVRTTGDDQTASNTEMTISLGTTVPVYGYVIGPEALLNENYFITLSTTATLLVTTNENDYTYTLAYNANGGSGAPANQTGSNVGTTPSYTFTVSSTVPTRTGYTFLGWSRSSTATSASYTGGSSITVTSAGTTTLYAVWKIKTYTVTYNKGNNGTGTNVTDTKTYGVALTLKGAIFTRTGYTQTGWATSDGGSKTYNLSASYITNASVTLYPFWTANTYTITYNKGDYGTGSQVTDTKTYGVALQLRGATFTRTHYSQDGWSINSNGSTKDYNLSGSYTANSARTLYPHWKADTYTVSYNANGGTGAPSSQTKTYGVTLVLSSTAPTRTNYLFQGWATSSTGSVVYQPGGNYTANAAVTLYAIWKAAKSTLSSVTSSVNIGSSGTASWNIINSAYTFKLVITYGNAPPVTVNVAANTSSTSFTIPTTWYPYLPNVTSVTATATLTTYSGGTSLGSTSKTFTVAVASSVKPTISSFTHSPYSSNSVVNGWGVYVQGYSQVDLSVSATAGTGASIVSYAFSGAGVSQSGTESTARSSVLTNTGRITYSVTVTDSRGRTATSTLSGNDRPYFYGYNIPVVTSMTAFRSDSSGNEDAISGTYITTSATYKYSSCGNKNSLSVRKIEYKQHSASSWTSGVAPFESGISYTIGGGSIVITKSYDVRCTITDALSHTATYVVLVPPIVGFAIGLNNDRARFGGPVEKAGLQVDWDAEFGGVVSVVNRMASARLSSAGWYRVCWFEGASQYSPIGALGALIRFNIVVYGNDGNNGNHQIDYTSTYGTGNLKFVNEQSNGVDTKIDKIRCMQNGNDFYIDVHFNSSANTDVYVFWEFYTSTTLLQRLVTRNLTAVTDAPPDETSLATYTFSSSGVFFGDLYTNGTLLLPFFTKGTAIPANANMNTYTTPGVYYATVAVASTLSNANITTVPFKLIVMQMTGSDIMQIHMADWDNCIIAMRRYNGSTWSGYKRITPA